MDLVLKEDNEPRVRVAVRAGDKAAIAKIALDVEGQAKLNLTASNAIDTGALKASIHSDFSGHAGYAASRSDAYLAAGQPGQHSGVPNQGFAMFPEMNADEDGGALVAVGAEYGIYVEYGTVRMAARPYLIPAYQKVLSRVEGTVVDEINRRL